METHSIQLVYYLKPRSQGTSAYALKNTKKKMKWKTSASNATCHMCAKLYWCGARVSSNTQILNVKSD